MDSEGDGDLFLTQSTFVEKEELNDDDDFSFRFGEPLNESEILEKIGTTVPKSTRFKNTWAVGVFKRWQEERRGDCRNPTIPGEHGRTNDLRNYR